MRPQRHWRNREPDFRLGPHRPSRGQEDADVAPTAPEEPQEAADVAFAAPEGPSTYFPPRAAQARPHTPRSTQWEVFLLQGKFL